MALQNSETETRGASGNESVAPFTLEDVNEAIADIRAGEVERLAEEGYLTALAWAAMWGVTERTVQRKMRVLAQKKLVDIKFVSEPNAAGRIYNKPVYKILIEKEK